MLYINFPLVKHNTNTWISQVWRQQKGQVYYFNNLPVTNVLEILKIQSFKIFLVQWRLQNSNYYLVINPKYVCQWNIKQLYSSPMFVLEMVEKVSHQARSISSAPPLALHCNATSKVSGILCHGTIRDSTYGMHHHVRCRLTTVTL